MYYVCMYYVCITYVTHVADIKIIDGKTVSPEQRTLRSRPQRPSLPPLAKLIIISAVPANTLLKDSGISWLHIAKAFATS